MIATTVTLSAPAWLVYVVGILIGINAFLALASVALSYLWHRHHGKSRWTAFKYAVQEGG